MPVGFVVAAVCLQQSECWAELSLHHLVLLVEWSEAKDFPWIVLPAGFLCYLRKIQCLSDSKSSEIIFNITLFLR